MSSLMLQLGRSADLRHHSDDRPSCTVIGAGAGDAGSDSDRYQIDFLNSVIVDQKGKIDELNHKIKVLAEVGDVEPNGYELDFR